MVLMNLTPLAGLNLNSNHVPHALAWGHILLPLRGAIRMRFARYSWTVPVSAAGRTP